MTARRFSLIMASVAVALAIGLSVGLLFDDRSGGGSGKAAIGGPFELVDHTGQTVTEANFEGQYTLVYFGFTFCPDVCPTELQAMSVALDLLGDDAEAITPIFITVDPERDTVELMATYREHFHPRLQALTGSSEQIAAAARAYRVYYAKVEDESSTEYLVDHSAFVYLMDRNGEYLKHFAPNTPPESYVEAIRAIL